MATVHHPDQRATRPHPAVAVAWAALGIGILALALAGGSGPLTAPKAIVLGAVEGITEYLPVSSTGHLLVTQRLLDLGSAEGKVAADTYAISIQLGAIAAVIALYRRRLLQLLHGLLGRDDEGRALLVRLVVAFLPAAAIGVAFNNSIKDTLFGPWPVVAAWALGGAFLLVWKPRQMATRSPSGTPASPSRRPASTAGKAITDISVRAAVVIGVAQALALWPGVSRSLVTIVAALAIGCTLAAALEFSFLLGLATLTAATVLDLAQDGDTLLDDYGWRTPLLGALVAFATALFAVRWLVGYLRTRPFSDFGWYRLAAAAVTVVLIVVDAI